MTPLRAALLALPLVPTLAVAQEGQISTADPQAIRDMIVAHGHKARVDVQDNGDPLIDARTPDGINYTVFFMNCHEGRDCYDLQLRANFDLDQGLTPQWANDWNYQWAFGRAAVDPNGDPELSFQVLNAGGLSATDFDNVLALWDSVLGGFLTDIGW